MKGRIDPDAMRVTKLALFHEILEQLHNGNRMDAARGFHNLSDDDKVSMLDYYRIDCPTMLVDLMKAYYTRRWKLESSFRHDAQAAQEDPAEMPPHAEDR